MGTQPKDDGNKIHDMEMSTEEGSEGGRSWRGGGEYTLLAAQDTGWITQEELLGITTLIDNHNGFNKQSRLEVLWSLQHCLSEGAQFSFNCYKHWAQMIV